MAVEAQLTQRRPHQDGSLSGVASRLPWRVWRAAGDPYRLRGPVQGCGVREWVTDGFTSAGPCGYGDRCKGHACKCGLYFVPEEVHSLAFLRSRGTPSVMGLRTYERPTLLVYGQLHVQGIASAGPPRARYGRPATLFVPDLLDTEPLERLVTDLSAYGAPITVVPAETVYPHSFLLPERNPKAARTGRVHAPRRIA